MPENREGLSQHLTPIQLDLVNAWAESAELRKEVADYKNAVDVIVRSHVNWQHLANGVNLRLTNLQLAISRFLANPCPTPNAKQELETALTISAYGPVIPETPEA